MSNADDTRLRQEIEARGEVVALGPCWGCGEGPAGNYVAFLPNDSQAYGAPPGKTRLFLYPLCWRCWQTTTPEQRDELFEAGQRRRAA